MRSTYFKMKVGRTIVYFLIFITAALAKHHSPNIRRYYDTYYDYDE